MKLCHLHRLSLAWGLLGLAACSSGGERTSIGIDPGLGPIPTAAETLAAFENAPTSLDPCTESAPSPDRSVQRVVLEAGSKERVLVVQNPLPADPNPPAIIVLHAGGAHFADDRALAFLPGLEDYVKLYPRACQVGAWTFPGGALLFGDRVDKEADPEFLSAVADYAINTFNVDPDRIFLLGVSRGGIMAYYTLSKIPSRFAGAAIVIGNMVNAFGDSYSIPDPTSVLIMNGTADELMVFEGATNRQNPGFSLLSSDVSATKVALANGCTDKPIPVLTNNNQTRETQYQVCLDQVEVLYVECLGAGHQFPNLGGLPNVVTGEPCNAYDGQIQIDEFFKQQF